MRILVTGASGFIGSQLCHALSRQGHDVIALHRPASILAALEGIPVQRRIGDMLDPPSLQAALRGVEVVFHTAAPMRPSRDPMATIDVHLRGTRNVLETARRAGVRRLVHTSSVAALGVPDAPPSDSPEASPLLDERHTWNYLPERWPYAFGKHASEQEVRRAVEAGLEAVIVNPSAVFGAGDWYRTQRSLIAQAARGTPIPILPGGVNAVHIDDVILGHLAALERGRPGERYILGGENLTLEAMLRITAEVVGRRPPAVRLPLRVVPLIRAVLEPLRTRLRLPIEPSLLELAGRYFFYDTRKARTELGLPASRPYRLAAEETLGWLRSIGALSPRVTEPGAG